jgi:hypothetical protein
MPQERKWIPSVVKEEDRQCWEDILRNHGTNISGSLLALNGLEEFVRVNDGFPGCSRDEILRMYAGQNARHGMAASTIAARLECFQSFRVDPRNVGAARERVHACATVSAVRRWRGSAGATNVKPLLPKETWADVLEAPRPPSMKEETHSFWRLRFLVIVITGCRPAHILGIREIQIRGEAMGVKWGARKILITPPTDYVWYPFAWSGVTPPPDLLPQLRVENLKGGTARNYAASCNSWLSRLGTGLTRKEIGSQQSGLSSACPRVSLTNKLAGMVREGTLTAENFRILLDHNYLSSITFYGRDEAGV